MDEILELLHCVGKLALEEGEAWRLKHAELMDAYEACLGVPEYIKDLEVALDAALDITLALQQGISDRLERESTKPSLWWPKAT